MFGLITSARLSQQTKEPIEASGDPVVTDRAEWKQFYDAVAGSERPAEIAQPADAAPERRAAEDQAPRAGTPPIATTTLPIAPHSASSELTAKPDVPPAQAAVPPDPPRERSVDAVVSNEPGRDQKPQEAVPSVAASEKEKPALATAPVPPLDVKSAPSTTPPATRPAPTPRAKVAAPAPPVPGAARVKQATPQSEPKPERSRPSVPPPARVAVPRQRPVPQSDGPHQSGALSYAPPQNSAFPPGGPQFGPYFPYGSSPPPTQRSRTQRSRSPQPFDAQFSD